jgi:hypothetical protein
MIFLKRWFANSSLSGRMLTPGIADNLNKTP